MRTMLKIRVLTVGVSCALLGALAVPMARAAPELDVSVDVSSRAGVLLSAGLTHWERARPLSESRLDRAHVDRSSVGTTEAVRQMPPSPAVGLRAGQRTADRTADAPTGTPSLPTPLNGPGSPTPFGLSLAGLVGVGAWMRRRRCRMMRPLI